jgi:hypothetical protein
MLSREDQAVREMLSLVRQTLVDGEVSEAEAEDLRVWLKHNPDMTVSGMGQEVAEKLVRVFADRTITLAEREELLALLQGLVGQDPE